MRHHFAPILFAVGLLIPTASRCNDLLDAYSIAKTEDPTYQAALDQRDQSVEARPQAWSAVLPQLSAQGMEDDNKLHVLSTGSSNSVVGGGAPGSGPSPPLYYFGRNYSVNLTQTVFDWGAFQNLAAASHQVAQAQALLRSAQQNLITRTAAAYFNVLSARDTLRADVDAQIAFKEQMEQASSKYHVGLVAVTDVKNAKAAYDTSSAAVIADRAALDNARRAMGVLVGKRVDMIGELQQQIPLLPPNPDSVEEWCETASHDSPDLMASLDAAEVAHKQVAALEGKYLPSIGIVGTKSRNTTHTSIGSDEITDQIGLSFNWNLFNGGLRESQIRQAKAAYRQAQQQYELERRTIDQNTRNDYEGVISGIAGVNATYQAVLSNQTSVVATTVGLKVGTRTEIDVVNARQALAAAEKAYYQARYTYLNSVLSLKLDAGQLTEAGLTEIDGLLSSSTVPAEEPSQPLPLPNPDESGQTGEPPQVPFEEMPGTPGPSASMPGPVPPEAVTSPQGAKPNDADAGAPATPGPVAPDSLNAAPAAAPH